MVNSCCAIGCTTRYTKGAGISFHTFPCDEKRKSLWTRAVKRKNWAPTPYSVICGKHFQTGNANREIWYLYYRQLHFFWCSKKSKKILLLDFKNVFLI